MKYTIEGFSQKTLIANELDSRDAVFLRWFTDWQATGRMKKYIEGEDVFFWIDHETVALELPILGRSTRESVKKYLSQLVKKTALQARVRKNGRGRGSSSFYRIAPELLAELLSDSIPPAGAEKLEGNDCNSPNDLEGNDCTPETLLQGKTSLQGGKRSPKAPRERRERVARRKTPPKVSKPKQETTELGERIDFEATDRRGSAPSWTRDEREGVKKMATKYGPEAVLRAWRAYLQRGKSVSIRFFLQDTQISDYATSEPKPPTLCGECGAELFEWEATIGCTKCAKAAREKTAGDPETSAALWAPIREIVGLPPVSTEQPAERPRLTLEVAT